MIDELAKVACRASGAFWPEITRREEAHYREIAAAVLRRLREPTPGMLETAYAQFGMEVPDLELFWKTMIDAALGEKA